MTSHVSWDRSHGRVHSLSPSPQDMGPRIPTPPPLVVISRGHHWRPVQTCSFQDTPSSHQYGHLVGTTKTHTIGKRAVRILLECFLVLY